jgi:C4-type Zn-finger protein
MHCPICNSADTFNMTEYVMPHPSGTVRAPAIECSECGAVVLNEVVAHSAKELAAVREAQNLRLDMIAETDHRRASRRSRQVVALRLAGHG